MAKISVSKYFPYFFILFGCKYHDMISSAIQFVIAIIAVLRLAATVVTIYSNVTFTRDLENSLLLLLLLFNYLNYLCISGCDIVHFSRFWLNNTIHIA